MKRTEQQIDAFLLEFAKLWKAFPKLRFAQLVNILTINTDSFYMEDEKMLKAMKDFASLYDR